MSAHARLSPSSATRWLRCPGSVKLTEHLPDTTSEYAAEGTFAHEISDICLTEGKDPIEFVGTEKTVDGYDFVFLEEWAKYLQPGIDRVRELGGKFYSEHKVDLSRWLPGQFGTLDRGIVRPDLIIIDDLKFGAGIPVSPVDNEQLSVYALGFWDNVARHETDATDFLFIIDQPRCAGGGGEWYTTLDELLAFGEKIKAAGEATYEDDAPIVAGEKQCYWCPANPKNGGPGCATMETFVLDMIGAEFGDLDEHIDFGTDMTIDNSLVTPERRSFILRHEKMITSWLSALATDEMNDYMAGRPTPGRKAVYGRKGNRHYIDEVEAEQYLTKALRDKAYTKKLKSPNQAEELLGPRQKKKFAEYWKEGDPKPTMVDADNPKPAIPTVSQEFDDMMGGDDDEDYLSLI